MAPFFNPGKKAVVRPLIKSSKLDKEFKKYWPISNLSFISKSIEKAVLLQLSTYFEDQNLLPTYLPTKVPTANTIQKKKLQS